MADVSPPAAGRGQIFVVAALALAVTFVVMGLLLNFAIFTENLATRDNNPEVDTAVQQRADITNGVGRAIHYVHTDENSSLDSSLGDELRALEDQYGRYSSTDGAAVSITHRSDDRGTRITQTDSTQLFTAGGTNDGDSDWTVATGVDPPLVNGHVNPAYFRQNITRDALFDATESTAKSDLPSSAYHVHIDDGSGTWNVYVFQNATDDTAYLLVESPAEDFSSKTDVLLDEFVDETCAVEDDTVTLSMVEGEFGGAACPELAFFPPSDSYDIEYRNGGQAQGTYDILLAKDSLDSSTEDNYYSAGPDNPHHHSAFYNVTVAITYATSDATFETTVDTTPIPDPASDAPGNLPTVEQFENAITDKSDSDYANYSVDWEVQDVDGNLDEVRLHLTNISATERQDTATVDVSDATASGSHTLKDLNPNDPNDEYAIRITVIDDRGNVVSATVRDTAEGTNPP